MTTVIGYDKVGICRVVRQARDKEWDMDSKVYKLPARFTEDHIERGLLDDERVTRWTRQHAFVTLTDDEWSEFESDAEHYATGTDFYPEYRGLIASARATLKALRQQGRP